MDAITGALRTTYPLSAIAVFAGDAPAPVITGGALYAGAVDLAKFPLASALPAWETRLYRPSAPGAVIAGVVYAATGGEGGFSCGDNPPQYIDGALAAVDATTGKVIWQERLSQGKTG
jgi:outer membrane protein assembly factor BamB